LFTKLQTQKGRVPFAVAMWGIAGVIMGTVLTIGIFTILTSPRIYQSHGSGDDPVGI
jgi:hypothetical protein